MYQYKVTFIGAAWSTLLLTASLAGTAFGQSEITKGDTVRVTGEDVPLKVSQTTVTRVQRGQQLTVGAVKDDWLWVSVKKSGIAYSGWVHSSQVSPDTRPVVPDVKPGDKVAIINDGTPLARDSEVLTELSKGQTLTALRVDRGRIWTQFLAPMELKGHKGVVVGVAFSPDGQLIASGGGIYDELGQVKVWAADTGKKLWESSDHESVVCDVAFSPDGQRMATGSRDKTVKVWDVKTQKVLLTLEHSMYVSGVSYSPDGKLLAVKLRGYHGDPQKRLYGTRTLTVWDVTTGRERITIEVPSGTAVSFSPSGQLIAVAGQQVHILDLETGKRKRMLLHAAEAWDVAFSPDGKRIASAGWDRKVKMWEVETGSELFTIPLSAYGVSVAYSPNGDLIASGQYHGKVHLWNASNGELVTEIQAHSEPVRCVAFSPDGKRLASCSNDSGVTIWNIGDGKGVEGWVSASDVMKLSE